MKHILHFIFLLAFIQSSAQTVNLVLDTLRFADAKYYEGQQIQLGNGTNATKDFTHIKTGKTIDSLISLPAAFANQTVTVEMVYKNDFGFVIVASTPGKPNKQDYILIRVEQALSSRELMKPKEISREALANVAVL
jgi:hypothetical protein